MQPHHVFSHQTPYHTQNDWQHHPQHPQTQYAQSQAAAAANTAAQQQQQQQAHQAQHQQHPQQQNYGRSNGNTANNNANTMNLTLGGNGAGVGGGSRDPTLDHGPGSIFSTNGEQMSEENRRVLEWIAQVLNAHTRESALLELSKKREQVPELALILWHSFGVMTSLLQEIISVYPLLNPSQLTAAASNRVCNALALLQCVASHSETRGLFLGAHIPLFLYPFLNTTSKSRPFEYLRLTSLGVIGALVKNDSSDVIHFLLTTEIIPLCLRIMETGSELSKTVAIFIVQKILLDDTGLQYICQTYERFYAVGTVLSNMVTQLVDQQTVRLLKHVVRCFLRLSDNARAREALRQCLPEPLRDATFSLVLRDDAATKRCLAQLLLALSDQAEPSMSSTSYHPHQPSLLP
ncbi:Cell differentiation protein rcd1 [Meristemomyces frigidus]|uniref:Cell differentiation protein rcd1 n=1 Tax=Meristemomyces frigidus TaxID=1508187 RepID=A0AAN7TUD9_9PEZI|nr:Cell differentiation protein rcd1 [Meristemomyces frigidus]